MIAQKFAILPKLSHLSLGVLSSPLGINIQRDDSVLLPTYASYRPLIGDDEREEWGNASTDVFKAPYYL